MRILEINFARGWRGGERQTLYTAIGLSNAKFDVTVLCRANDLLDKRCQENKITTIGLNKKRQMLAYLIKQGKQYDIIHCQGSQELTFAILAKRFHQKPVVLTKRVEEPPKGKLTKWKYNQTDAVIAISKTIYNRLTDFGVPNVMLIPSMIMPIAENKNRNTKFVEDFNIQGKKIIATTTAFDALKDPFTMVKAIKQLSLTRNDFVFLHFGTGKLQQQVVDLIAANNLQDKYLLVGRHADVEEFYYLFDVFAMSSIREGLGSSVLDAFYYKVPVAATKTGGLAELLSDGRGCLSPVQDEVALANNINDLLSNETLKIEVIDKAYNYVIANHLIPPCIEKYKTLFEQLA